jgi:hypothetical protein
VVFPPDLRELVVSLVACAVFVIAVISIQRFGAARGAV